VIRSFAKLPTYSRLLFSVLKTPVLMTVAAVGNLFLMICAVLFYYFEYGINPNVSTPFDAIWWAFSTVTTVGYGDVVPSTTAGRLVAIALIVVGVITFVSFATLLVAIASARATDEIVGLEMRETRELVTIAESLRSIEQRIETIEHRLSKRP